MIPDVVSTLRYVRKFSGHTVLIKLGGAALEDLELIGQICDDLVLIRSVGISVIIVHGGGPAINQELTRRGITWEFVEGQRVTTPEMMDVIEMVLCGSVNRRIVRQLNQLGVPAIGISGSDESLLLCDQADERLNRVGSVRKVNSGTIDTILNSGERGAIPVIAPVGVGTDGKAFNINADWAAVKIAEAMNIQKMIFLTDQDGILGPSENGKDNGRKLISQLDAGELENLIESEVVTGGMLAKTRTILHALKSGVKDVHVLNARRPHALIEELFTEGGVGTVCRVRARVSAEATL